MIYNATNIRSVGENPVGLKNQQEESVALKNYDSDEFEDSESSNDSKTHEGASNAPQTARRSCSHTSSSSPSER